MAKSMVGFDIGTSALKVVQWNGSEIVKAITASIPDNLVKNGQIVSHEAMKDLIKAVVKENKISGRDCAMVLPPSQFFLRHVSMPAMTVEQLAVNLPYEFRDFLTSEKDKYFYDYAVDELVKDEEGVPQQMELTACAVRKETIENYRSMFRQAGFRLKTAIPAECAYSNLIAMAAKDPNRELCIIDLGYTNTRVHFYVGSRFETTRAIDISLMMLDQAVGDAMGVDDHIAHTYVQTNHGDVQHMEGPMNLYQSVALDLRKTINFYGFNHRDSNLQDAWCIGGGIQIAPLMETIAQTLELNIHAADQLIPSNTANLPQLSAYAAAIGAAIQ